MKQDIRDTQLYQEATALFTALRHPGTGRITDAADIHAAPDGVRAVFAGTLMDRLEGDVQTRICQVDLKSGDVRILTLGPQTDRLPKYSPDGTLVAFLSDRHNAGDFQLYVLDPATGVARSTPHVEGWVEYLHWSPDGKRILLGVAGRGADIAGAQGAIASQKAPENLPAWMPQVETGEEAYRWRRAWVYELELQCVRQLSAAGTNVWEAVWCGNETLAAVVSPGSSEGLWYGAHLSLIALETGQTSSIYEPRDQLGSPAASPSGDCLAIVEAVCSDRGVVAGDLLLIDRGSGKVQRVDTDGVDVSCIEWRSERTLLVSGHRGFETVVGIYDASSHAFSARWASQEMTTAGRYSAVSGLNSSGDCVVIGESFTCAPQIAVIRASQYRAVRSLDAGYAALASAIQVEQVHWSAPDGLKIQGWLLKLKGQGPHPLVMNVHGGPVWHWRPMWLGRGGAVLMLIRRGFAVFLPNPRGSSGRGQDFARHVVGEMGGADTYDYLSGLDHLVQQGIADPKRLGVTGGSYGGFMTSWLITQDGRFAAAVPLAPVTNQVTEHLISNIPHFQRLFLADVYTNPTGKYFERSPIMHAHKAHTPTLNICGALDRVTPPEEAVQFHNALLENGVKSVLVTYPQEGHGVRKLPAAIDYAARVVAWFEEHMQPDIKQHQ